MANGGSGYTLHNDGTLDVKAKPGSTPQEYYYWQVGTTAHYNTGTVKHDITLSYNQAWRNRKSAYNNGPLLKMVPGICTRASIRHWRRLRNLIPAGIIKQE